MNPGGPYAQRLMPRRNTGIASTSVIDPAPVELAQDLIRGADDIAKALGLTVTQVYEISKRIASGKPHKRPMPPIFNDGVTLCLRRSSLVSYYAKRERAALAAAGVV